jgi:uncharacterized protein (UPF0276 family)
LRWPRCVLTGIAYRPGLAAWLATRPRELTCLELTVDQVPSGAPGLRPDARRARRFVLKATRLSVGSPRPLDASDLRVAARAACAVDPIWMTTFLGWRRRPEADLAYPEPVAATRSTLGQVIANCRQIIEACGRPLLVENVAAFHRPDDSMCESDFINQLCDATGCGLVLDLTALTVDARFGVDYREWLWGVDPRNIVALHLGGWAARAGGRWAGRREGRIGDDVWELAREVIARAPVRAAILQHDGRVPSAAEIHAELRALAGLAPAAAPSLPASLMESALAAS